MSIQPILTEADYDAALARLTVLLDAVNDTSENKELSTLAALIEAYEEKHFPIPPISFGSLDGVGRKLGSIDGVWP